MAEHEGRMETKHLKVINMLLAVIAAVAVVALVVVLQQANQEDSSTNGDQQAGDSNANDQPDDMVVERMADPEYRAALKALADERRRVVSEASGITKQMEAIVKVIIKNKVAEGVELSEDELKALARQDPKWVALDARIVELHTQLLDLRSRAETLVRERMKEQYAARAESAPNIFHAPPEIKLGPDTEAILQQASILTNRPPPVQRPNPAQHVVQPVDETEDSASVPQSE
jgi:hypothetical protein